MSIPLNEKAVNAEADYRRAHNIDGVVQGLSLGGMAAGLGLSLVNPAVGLPITYGSLGAGVLGRHFTEQDLSVARKKMSTAFSGETNVAVLKETGVAPAATPTAKKDAAAAMTLA